MSWLIAAKIREIENQIKDRKSIVDRLKIEISNISFYKFNLRDAKNTERIFELGVIHGLEEAILILQNKNIR